MNIAENMHGQEVVTSSEVNELVETTSNMEADLVASGNQQSPIIMFKWGSKQKPFRCQLCDMSFEDGEQLRVHMTKHTRDTPQKPFPCKVCPKSFKTIKSLERHALIHYGQTLKRCKYCYKVFANRENLAQHILIHDGKKPYKCELCNDSFIFKQGLEAHRLIHTGLRPFVCEICNKGFNRKDILERHMVVHNGDRKYKCVECGKSFAHSFVLKRHSRTVHSQEFDGKECGICGKYIKAKENMRRHMRLHTGERPFKCPHCDKAFTQKQHVIDHMVIHSNAFPHKCNQCDREFKYKRSLNRHLMWHAGGDGFLCAYPNCRQTYTSKTGLDRHMMSHEDKAYKCNICKHEYKTLGSLRKHHCLNHNSQSEVTIFKDIGVGTEDFNDLKSELENGEEINERELVKSILGEHESAIATHNEEVVVSESNGNEIGENDNQIIYIVLEEGQKQIILEESNSMPIDSTVSHQESVEYSGTTATRDGYQTEEFADLQERTNLIQTLIDYAEKHKSIDRGESTAPDDLQMHNYCVSK